MIFYIDSQSVKTTGKGKKGYDGGRRVKGRKRTIAVDTMGIPHAIHITKANVSDRAGAIEMFTKYYNKKTLKNIKNVIADGGYRGKNFANSIKGILNSSVEVAKRNELHTFKVIPKRWIVERSLTWINNFRRLSKDFEETFLSSINFVRICAIRLALRR